MDRIVIAGLEVWAHHGVLPHEAEVGQRFVVDVALELDLAPAGASDDLADTVDYGTLGQRIHAVVAGPPRKLIEAVAADVADLCLEDERVEAVEVVLHKPDAPFTVPAREARVEVRRARSTDE